MTEYQRWDDFLIAEHEMIERSMAVLKNGLEHLADVIQNPAQLKRAIDFLLVFGDQMHNKKEEDFLFPLMEKRGIPASGGPIGVMIQEHEAERQLLLQMTNDVDPLTQASDEIREQFKASGLEYLTIRAEHIWKENDVLYPLGRKVFKEGDNERLLFEFNRIDHEAYGQNARQSFLQMIDEVEKGVDEKKGLIHDLSYEQMEAIMETLPFEVTFVDTDDTVAYFNRLDKPKIFPRTRSVVGRKVKKCHPEKSVGKVTGIVEGFKNKTLDKADFWIDFRGDKVLIRYFPVYSKNGDYLGVLEVTQSIGWIQEIEGEKRLLD